jgi:hypothetical protein
MVNSPTAPRTTAPQAPGITSGVRLPTITSTANALPAIGELSNWSIAFGRAKNIWDGQEGFYKALADTYKTGGGQGGQ